MSETDPEVRELYLNYLLETDPLVKINKTKWAEEHGVNRTTVIAWEKRPDFKEAIDARLRAVNLDPLRLQKVLNAMHEQAVNGNTKAAELVLRYADRLSPIKPVIEEVPASKLSNTELTEAILARDAKLARLKED